MARKEVISHEELRKAAFSMAREQGIEEVTARKLAAYAGCSTQPIFRHYSCMEDCYSEIFQDALLFFDEFYNAYNRNSQVPFVNLGMVYISFAEKEPKLFEYLFMKKNNYDANLYTILNGRTGAVKEEINKVKESGVVAPDQIFMKMWMLIHGAACMTITGDYDLSPIQTRLQLEDAYKAFVR